MYALLLRRSRNALRARGALREGHRVVVVTAEGGGEGGAADAGGGGVEKRHRADHHVAVQHLGQGHLGWYPIDTIESGTQ